MRTREIRICLFTNLQKQLTCLQLKISLFFEKESKRHLQTSRANNSKTLKIENVKFSGYCFYMNTNIQKDFQICISLPLMKKNI